LEFEPFDISNSFGSITLSPSLVFRFLIKLRNFSAADIFEFSEVFPTKVSFVCSTLSIMPSNGFGKDSLDLDLDFMSETVSKEGLKDFESINDSLLRD